MTTPTIIEIRQRHDLDSEPFEIRVSKGDHYAIELIDGVPTATDVAEAYDRFNTTLSEHLERSSSVDTPI